MIKTISDLENVINMLVANNVASATLQVTIEESEGGRTSSKGGDNECDLTPKTLPISLQFFPKPHILPFPDEIKLNEHDDTDVDDDILYHST